VDYSHRSTLTRNNYLNKHEEFVSAAEEYQNICESGHATPQEKQRAYEQMVLCRQTKDAAYAEYQNVKNGKRLFMGLLVGLAVLLVCGSAAAFAPPALVPILFIASKIASAYLGTIAAGRFLNWLASG